MIGRMTANGILAAMAALELGQWDGDLVLVDHKKPMGDPLGMMEPPDLDVAFKLAPMIDFGFSGAPNSKKYDPTPSKHMPHQGNREMQRRLKRMKGK